MNFVIKLCYLSQADKHWWWIKNSFSIPFPWIAVQKHGLEIFFFPGEKNHPRSIDVKWLCLNGYMWNTSSLGWTFCHLISLKGWDLSSCTCGFPWDQGKFYSVPAQKINLSMSKDFFCGWKGVKSSLMVERNRRHNSEELKADHYKQRRSSI